MRGIIVAVIISFHPTLIWHTNDVILLPLSFIFNQLGSRNSISRRCMVGIMGTYKHTRHPLQKRRDYVSFLFLSKAVRAYRNTCFCKQARGLYDNIVKSIMYINVRYKLFLTKDNFTSNAS